MTKKRLFLADLSGRTEAQVKDHIAEKYAGDKSGFDYGEPTEAEKTTLREYLENVNVLVAYESVGSWGCDSASYFLLQDKSSGALSEVIASHCSCYGFEGQWNPNEVDVSYLTSDKFYLGCGGYDNSAEENSNRVKAFLADITPALEAHNA